MSYKIIRLLVTVVLLAVFLSFAAYNQGEVTIAAPWPFNHLVYYSTVAWTALGGFVIGVVFSILFLGSSYWSTWSHLRKKQKENTKLEMELAQVKRSPLETGDTSSAVLS